MNDVYFGSYADDNTPFFLGNDLDEVLFKLQNASKTLFQWFAGNQMKAGCYFISSSNLKTRIMIENRQVYVKSSSICEKLLGVFFRCKLTFQSRICNICEKAAHE